MNDEIFEKIEKTVEENANKSYNPLVAFMSEGFQMNLVQILKLVIIGWLITIIVAFIMYQVQDASWKNYLSQYEMESYSLSTEGGGNANYIGQDGDIYNGTSESAKNDKEERQG